MCLSVFGNHLNECRAVNYYILINMNSQIWFNYVQKYKLINICFVAWIASLIQHHAFRRTQKTENSLGSRPFRPRSAGTEEVRFRLNFTVYEKFSLTNSSRFFKFSCLNKDESASEDYRSREQILLSRQTNVLLWRNSNDLEGQGVWTH